MKGTLLVEADLDEALVDDFLSDAVTAGSDMITISFTAQAHRRMAESQPDAPEEMVRTNEAKLARDDAVRRAQEQSAPRSMRKRGAAGFELCRNDPGFTGDWYAYKAKTTQGITNPLHCPTSRNDGGSHGGVAKVWPTR